MSPRLAPLARELPAGWVPSRGHGQTIDTACVMDAVSWLAGAGDGRLTDHPRCVDPVLGAFCRSWNDALPDDERHILTPYAPRLMGTRGSSALATRRAWMATDWLARECTPVWLGMAGLDEHARALASLSPLDSLAAVREARPGMEAAHAAGAARAAWAARGAGVARAAWAAARECLDPTRRGLQRSALALLDRMIAAEEVVS